MEYGIDIMVADDWDQVRSIYLEGIATGNATFEADAPHNPSLSTAASRQPTTSIEDPSSIEVIPFHLVTSSQSPLDFLLCFDRKFIYFIYFFVYLFFSFIIFLFIIRNSINKFNIPDSRQDN